jgi:hypothetical protein
MDGSSEVSKNLFCTLKQIIENVLPAQIFDAETWRWNRKPLLIAASRRDSAKMGAAVRQIQSEVRQNNAEREAVISQLIGQFPGMGAMPNSIAEKERAPLPLSVQELTSTGELRSVATDQPQRETSTVVQSVAQSLAGLGDGFGR